MINYEILKQNLPQLHSFLGDRTVSKEAQEPFGRAHAAVHFSPHLAWCILPTDMS